MREPTIELTPAANAFIRTHTAVEIEVPHNEECSICLENYHEELCVRIKDVGLCTCRIGQVCLGELLSSNPLQEKKCPLCRAVWIAGQAPLLTRYERNLRAFEHGRSLTAAFAGDRVPSASVFRPSDLLNSRPAAAGISASQPQSLCATATPFVPGRPSTIPLINLDSGDDASGNAYDAQVEDYLRLNRDIQDVRARASNTRPFEGMRREVERRRATRQRVIDRDSQNQVATTSTTDRMTARNVENTPRASHNPTPAPGSEGTLRRQASRAERDAHRSTQAAPVSSAQPLERPHQTPQNAPISTRRTSDRRATHHPPVLLVMPEHAQSSSGNYPTPSYSPASPTGLQIDDTYHNNIRTTNLRLREEVMNTRKADLIRRETNLSKRKRDLEKRESELNKRAKLVDELEALAARKKADAQRTEAKIDMLQQQKEEMKNAMKRCQHETEMLTKRHQHEMENLTKM